VEVGDLLGDVKAEARRAFPPGGGGAEALEGGEHAFPIHVTQPRPVVFNGDLNRAISPSNEHVNRLAGRRILERVAYKVRDRLLQLALVTIHHAGAFGNRAVKSLSLALGLRFKAAYDPLHEGRHVHRFHIETCLAGAGRRGEQLVDKVERVLGRLADQVEFPFCLLGQVFVLENDFREDPDAKEGIFKVVRRHPEKLRFFLNSLAQLPVRRSSRL
jgi:hypothetical protein